LAVLVPLVLLTITSYSNMDIPPQETASSLDLPTTRLLSLGLGFCKASVIFSFHFQIYLPHCYFLLPFQALYQILY
jgi:hypothetical protein